MSNSLVKEQKIMAKMISFNKYKYFTMLVISIVLMPAVLHADILYTFIQEKCDKEARTLTIKPLYYSNEEGEKRIKNPDKNSHYLSDISQKMLTCDFGEDQSIEFVAREDNLQKNSTIFLYLGYMQLQKTFPLNADNWKLSIQSLGKNKYVLKYCPSTPKYLYEKNVEAGCEIIDMLYNNALDSRLEPK